MHLSFQCVKSLRQRALPNVSRWRRGFQNWSPGKLYSPIPLKYVDSHETYQSTLHGFTEEHQHVLANFYKIRPSVPKLVSRLMDFTNNEIKTVKEQRELHPKQVLVESKPYKDLLVASYSPRPNSEQILSTLKSFPGASEHRQANYIEPAHLESLINFSMNKALSCVEVFRMLQAAGLPTTAREKAQYLYQTFRVYHRQFRTRPGSYLRNSGWKADFGHLWPDIMASKDTSALNTSSKLAYRARCPDTQNLVEYHLQNPNRFTYLTKLRASPLHMGSTISNSFTERHFVMDIVVFSSFISAMLNSRHKAQVELAEQRFQRLSDANRHIKPIYGSAQQVTRDISALDRANHIVLSSKLKNTTLADGVQLPLLIDDMLLNRMCGHYINSNKHDEASKILIEIAQRGDVLPRHLLFDLIQNPDVPLDTLESLFYLCCDVNTVHPRFITPSLASAWGGIIAKRTDMSPEDAMSLVEEYQTTPSS